MIFSDIDIEIIYLPSHKAVTMSDAFLSNITTVDDTFYTSKEISVNLKSGRGTFSIIACLPKQNYLCTLDFDAYKQHIKTSGFGSSTTAEAYFDMLKASIRAGIISMKNCTLLLTHRDEYMEIVMSFQMKPIDDFLADQLLNQLDIIRQIKQQLTDQHQQKMNELQEKLSQSDKKDISIEPISHPIVSSIQRVIPARKTHLLFPTMKKRPQCTGIKIV